VSGRALGLLVLATACRTATLDLEHPDPALAYVSDYFSFVGQDEHGRVCFALDNNRGRDGADYQSEHSLSLFDEELGWVALVGQGDLPNPTHALDTLPDDEFFTFEGTAENGIVIRSELNGIELAVEPVPRMIAHHAHAAESWMGASGATLRWHDRTLRGRVIYEFLSIPGFNRITRVYPGFWRDFQALYLRLEPAGDLYFHVQDNPALSELFGAAVGFLVRDDGAVDVLERVELEHVGHRQAFGFYRWPTSWYGRLGVAVPFRFELVERDVISNWVLGGYALGIAAGELELGGRRLTAYGFAELLD
jgi:hypothetical protein